MVGDFHGPVSKEILQAEIRKAVGELGATVNLTYQTSTDSMLQSKTRFLLDVPAAPGVKNPPASAGTTGPVPGPTCREAARPGHS